MYQNTNKRIVLIDKHTFEVVRIINGWHATPCYYSDWYTNGIKKLLEVEDMKGLCLDLLKLILSYVL